METNDQAVNPSDFMEALRRIEEGVEELVRRGRKPARVRKATKLEIAKRMIEDALKNGKRLTTDVWKELKEAGVSRRTASTARAALGNRVGMQWAGRGLYFVWVTEEEEARLKAYAAAYYEKRKAEQGNKPPPRK